MASKTSDPVQECLFVSCESSEPWSTFAVNPLTQVHVWDFKGSELQGVPVNNIAFIRDEMAVMSCSGKPMGHMISLQSKSRRHVRIPFPGPVSALAVSADGNICCCAIQEKIYTWIVSTGQLVTIVPAHFQDISRLAFSSNASLLVTAGKDGVTQVWNVADLMRPYDSELEKPEPLRSWSSHSLAVSDLHLSSHPTTPRIITASLDQTLQVHSVTREECLLRAAFDCPLTACTMDSAETSIFVGTSNGLICLINLLARSSFQREQHVSTVGSGGEIPFFIGHSSTVRRLALNLDATLLASGDEKEIRIWDVFSNQTLKCIPTKGPTSTHQFLPAWPSLMDPEFQAGTSLPSEPWKKQLSPHFSGRIPLKLSGLAKNDSMEAIMNDLIHGEGIMDAICEQEVRPVLKRPRKSVSPQDEREEVPDQLRKVRQANRELYEFMIEKILDMPN